MVRGAGSAVVGVPGWGSVYGQPQGRALRLPRPFSVAGNRQRLGPGYWARYQSSMFHMSDEVPGFLKKFSSAWFTTRAELR